MGCTLTPSRDSLVRSAPSKVHRRTPAGRLGVPFHLAREALQVFLIFAQPAIYLLEDAHRKKSYFVAGYARTPSISEGIWLADQPRDPRSLPGGACALFEAHQRRDGADSLTLDSPVARPHPRLTRTSEVVWATGAPRQGSACCTMNRPTAGQRDLARTAGTFEGARRNRAKGRRFTFDCSGLTRGIYFSHGIDLFEGRQTDGLSNGVRLISRYIRKHGRLHDMIGRPGLFSQHVGRQCGWAPERPMDARGCRGTD